MSMLKEGSSDGPENEGQPVETLFSPICAQVTKFCVRGIEKGGQLVLLLEGSALLL